MNELEEDTPFLRELGARYVDYVAEFRVGGRLPPMMELKRVHTFKVVENARAIVAAEAFAPGLAEASLAAALLHDAGRYEQLKRYNTFRDADSVDHAVFSRDVAAERGWLAGYAAAQAVLDAVLYHNRRELPPGVDAFTAAAAHVVRDADKLDIFRVLEERVATTDWRTDSTAFWNLAVDKRPNPAVVAAILAGAPVDYQNILSLADFVLIQVGWLASGLHYASARALARSRGHLEWRRQFLKQLADDSAVDVVCDFAAGRLND